MSVSTHSSSSLATAPQSPTSPPRLATIRSSTPATSDVPLQHPTPLSSPLSSPLRPAFLPENAAQLQQPLRLIAHHVEVRGQGKLYKGKGSVCTLKLNGHTVLQGEKLIFDQVLDLEAPNGEETRLVAELTLEAGSKSTMLALKATKNQYTYRGSISYADLRDNTVEYRIQLVRPVDELSGAQEVVLVVWCFTGFVPFRQVDGKLVRLGQAPLGLQVDISQQADDATLDCIKPTLLKLLELASHVDQALTSISALHSLVGAAYGLAMLALVFTNEHLAHHEKSRELAGNMISTMELVGASVKHYHGDLEPMMQAASLAVEQAALWLFRYGAELLQRTYSLSRNSKLKHHITILEGVQAQLNNGINTTIAAKDYEEYLARLRLQFPVSTSSKIPIGKYEKLGDPGCLPGTRALVLQELATWFHNPDSPTFFLLESCTGSGKSSVAEQLVSNYEELDQVLATFRFKGGDAEQRNLRSLTSALARSFIDVIPSTRRTFEVRHSQCRGLQPLAEFDKIICTLPQECFQGIQSKRLIVIDGVDESDDPKETMVALAEWIRTNPQSFKVLLTGRRFFTLTALVALATPLTQHQSLPPDDLRVDLLVQHLCSTHASVDQLTQARLVDAAEGLPLWVMRGFESFAELDDDNARMEACRELPNDHTLLYHDFERALSSNFPPAAADNAGAVKLLQALHAIISFLQSGRERISKDLLVGLFAGHWIMDAFVRLKPLLKGGMKDEEELSVLHSSFFTYVSGDAAPQRFKLTTPAHVVLMRRCFEVLRYALRPLLDQEFVAVEYAIKHWASHWLEAISLGDSTITQECMDLLYDFIKGEDAADGQLKRDDPRVAESEQRGGFASWAETHYKLQQTPGSRVASTTSFQTGEISQACARIAQESTSLCSEATFCKRVLDEYSTLAQRIEDPTLSWFDDLGEPCSGDCSTSFWFSLLAAAPRTSLLFQQISAQRASPRIDPLPSHWKPDILSRVALTTPQKHESALMDLIPPPALRLKSSHEKDVLLNLSRQRLLVLYLEPDRFLFIDVEATSWKAWILSLDQQERAHPLVYATEKGNIAAKTRRKEGSPPGTKSWLYDPLVDLEPKSVYLPRERSVKSLLARVVTNKPQTAGLQEPSQDTSRPSVTAGHAQKLQALRSRQGPADPPKRLTWRPHEISLPTAMLVPPDSAQATFHAASLSPWRLIVRHVELEGADTLRLKSSTECSLKLNEHTMRAEKFVFDQSVELHSRVELELRLAHRVGKLTSLLNRKPQGVAQDPHVFRGSFTYARFGTNAVEYRVLLESEATPLHQGSLAVTLVIWCFAGFGPFTEVDGKLQTSGTVPPGLVGSLSPRLSDLVMLPAWEHFKRALLELHLVLPDALRRHDAASLFSAAHARIQTAFSLTALSLVLVTRQLAKRDSTTELVAQMVRIMNLVWMRLSHGTEHVSVEEACLVVEKATLWFLRSDKSTFSGRVFFKRPNPTLHGRLAELRDAKAQLSVGTSSVNVTTS